MKELKEGGKRVEESKAKEKAEAPLKLQRPPVDDSEDDFLDWDDDDAPTKPNLSAQKPAAVPENKPLQLKVWLARSFWHRISNTTKLPQAAPKPLKRQQSDEFDDFEQGFFFFFKNPGYSYGELTLAQRTYKAS